MEYLKSITFFNITNLPLAIEEKHDESNNNACHVRRPSSADSSVINISVYIQHKKHQMLFIVKFPKVKRLNFLLEYLILSYFQHNYIIAMKRHFPCTSANTVYDLSNNYTIQISNNSLPASFISEIMIRICMCKRMHILSHTHKYSHTQTCSHNDTLKPKCTLKFNKLIHSMKVEVTKVS